MSQIENNPINSTENNTPNDVNTTNNNLNNNNSNNNNSTTTHYRGKNININFMKEMFKKNAILYIAILFAILAIGLLLAFSVDGQSIRVYDDSGYKVSGYNHDSEVAVFDFSTFAFFIALIICVIPPVLSITLFSWVYKRKKVDFVASMPLNKRTICISNTLLGVAFIIVSCILYVSSTAIGVAMSGKLFFAKQFLDIFVYTLLAMLFIFGICNLAMSKAGNVVTQLILIGLLLFLIPTGVRVYQYELERYSTYTIEGTGNLANPYDREFKTNYLPIPLNTVYGEKDNYVSPFKIGETLIYIVVIYGLTQYLFEHRNMEENQESFKSTILHEIVKGSTMVIILASMFVNALDGDLTIAIGLLFFIISIVYFVIYDFITSKKVKMSITVISLICTYVASFAFGLIYWEIDENIYGFDRRTDVASIESITIGLGVEIKDSGFIEKFMDTVFRESLIGDYYSEYDYDYVYDYDESEDDYEENGYVDENGAIVDEDVEDELEDKYFTSTKYDSYGNNKSVSISYRIKLKSGEVLDDDYLYINEKYFDKNFKAYMNTMQDSIIDNFEKNTAFWQKVVPPGNLKSVDKSEAMAAIRKIEKPIDLVSIIKSYSSVYYGETSYCGFYLNGFEVDFVDF